jgi:hypothetical protein
MTRTRFFSIVVGIAVMMAATCQLQAQQIISASTKRLLPAREFLFSAKKPEPADNLRSDMLKLLADSRAGKIAPHPRQMPAGKVHNLSTTAKIAIIAGVAVVVLAIVVLHSVKNLHCENRCVL